MKPTEELYYKYAGVISSVVDKYAYQCPDLADDLLLQAQLLFCQACVTYDPDHPSKATFETWLRNKLQDVSALVKKATRGPCLIKIEKVKKPAAKKNKAWARKAINPACSDDNNLTPIQTMRDISESTERQPDDDPIDISDVTCGYILEDYSKKLSDGTEEGHDYPKAMLPYIRALRGDSLRVFKDFCEGRFEREPRKNLTKAMQRARGIYDPRYLYRKVYRDCGWSLARVQNAWRGLHGILKNYLDGKMPAPITMATVTLPQNRKKARWRERFDELHKIPVTTYKALVQAGVISPIKKGSDENLDLSKYLLQTFTY